MGNMESSRREKNVNAKKKIKERLVVVNALAAANNIPITARLLVYMNLLPQPSATLCLQFHYLNWSNGISI